MRTTLVSQGSSLIAPVVPLLLCAPKFLDGSMSLGQVMQAASAFTIVQTAFGWLVDNYPRLADWNACARRIASLMMSLDGLERAERGDGIGRIKRGETEGDAMLSLNDLSVTLDDGTAVVGETEVVVEPGERLLVAGESGTGKSTLVRAIAGLWPWGEGEVVMQRAAGACHAEHGNDHDPPDHGEREGHRHAQRGDERDRHYHRSAGRKHVPDEHRFERVDRIGGRRDAAGQHAREPIREIARRMTREMAEQIAPQIAGDAHEGEARDPARDAPQQIVGCDKSDQQCKGEPDGMRRCRAQRQLINQMFHAVLGRDRAHDRRKDRCHNHGMARRTKPDIAENERKGARGVAAQPVGAVGCRRSVNHRPPLWG
jgi:energy-coupling factor transporter ATP-binding protein EcfA2